MLKLPVLLFLLYPAACATLGGEASVAPSSPSDSGKSYLIVTHNIENLFDADSIAVYDDYKPFAANGKPQYGNAQLLKKIENVTALMKAYDGGRGPDVLMAVEIEADHSPGPVPTPAAFLKTYQQTSLKAMLGEGFNREIATLPAEYLLLKGFWDAGMRDYDLAVLEPPKEANGNPSSVIKNVVFSRLPILHAKTRQHPTVDARPVLEVWLNVEGDTLITFTNHWKSGASDPRQEATRLQNARVLRERVDALLGERPSRDILIAGDLNSDYNQIERYTAMSQTGINTILRAVGDEQAVARSTRGDMYNLWYELPASERRSDQYQGYWGTLMHLIISPGLYDDQGLRYLDQSFSVGAFPGLNANRFTLQPIRWSSAAGGMGFSDHFPLAMRVTKSQKGQALTLRNPGTPNSSWKPLRVEAVRPPDDQLHKWDSNRSASYLSPEYYDVFFRVSGTLNTNGSLKVGAIDMDLYSPAFNIKQALEAEIKANASITFVGRLSNFRNRWQFIIDDRSFIQ